MNKDNQRIAIAEYCGWKFETGEKYIGGTSIRVTSPTGKSANGYVGKAYRSNDSISGWDSNDGVYFGIEDIFKHPNHVFGPVPDYLNDLNAMHEAEKMLTVKQQHKFAEEVGHIIYNGELSVPDFRDNWYMCYLMMHTTAAQRAEAFLKTIGKWEDGK